MSLAYELPMKACDRCGDVFARTGEPWGPDETFVCDPCRDIVRDALRDALAALDDAIVYLDAAGLRTLVRKTREIVKEITLE